MVTSKKGDAIIILSTNEINDRLQTLSDWNITVDGEIRKTIAFQTYLEGVDFVLKVGHEAESANHHPIITIDFKKVTIQMKTHDENGLTEKDFSLAHAIEQIL